jgi:Cu2+-exporting ATPase
LIVAAAASCTHCGLPIGSVGRHREVHGEDHWFCCYGCCLAFQFRHGASEEPQAAAWLIRLGVGAFLAMNIMTFSWMLYGDVFSGDDAWLRDPVHWLLWVLATPLLVLLGGPFFAGAWRALREGRLVADTLVAIGVLSAYGYSVWQLLRGSPLVYFDTATMVLLLFTLGRMLEAQARARAARSLAPMLAAERAQALVVRNGVASARPVAEVQPGDLVRVLPGERVAIDGVVLEGRSECDESVLTGQPAPQAKAAGAAVWAGSLNGTGLLLVRATAPGLQTRWVRIARMVREALAVRSLAGDRIDRIAAAFIPGVLLLALATAWFWLARAGPDAALLAGLAVLVVACPCSLGLAAPMASVLAIGQAAQRGILVRGGGVLERLALLRGIAFDKTGTLTGDALRIEGVALDQAARAEALRKARALALGSDHPVARAVLADTTAIAAQAAADLQAFPGAGLAGRVDGECCVIGSADFLARMGCPVGAALLLPADEGSTTAFLGWGGLARARLDFSLAPAAGARELVAQLQQRGFAILLLSGDGEGAVRRLAALLGIAQWHAGVGPEAKVAALRSWSGRQGPIAMVGDGLNDGPVLAAAAVGIAVGDATDLARESADVVLPPGGLLQLSWLLEQAHRVRGSVRANVLWAFGYNAVALSLAASGLLRPVLAAALMGGSSLLVVSRSWLAQRRAEAAEADGTGALRTAAAGAPLAG